LKPYGQNILVERLDPETKTAGGLYIPETSQKERFRAKIVALGRGVKMKSGKWRPFGVKVGDIVLTSTFNYPQVKIEGKEMLLIEEPDIFGVIEDL
jgi:chaperonin GroES